jgi:hypothetical protein
MPRQRRKSRARAINDRLEELVISNALLRQTVVFLAEKLRDLETSIRTHLVQIVDASGAVVAELGSSSTGHAMLRIGDGQGQPLAIVSADAGGGTLALMDRAGQIRVVSQIVDGGGVIAALGSDGDGQKLAPPSASPPAESEEAMGRVGEDRADA